MEEEVKLIKHVEIYDDEYPWLDNKPIKTFQNE
jgi:hypothetical protein